MRTIREACSREAKGRHDAEFLFHNFPSSFMHSWLQRVYVYSSYLFSWFIAFQACCEPSSEESEKKTKTIFSAFSETERKTTRSEILRVCGAMTTRLMERGDSRLFAFIYLIYLLLLYLWMLLVINFRVINHHAIVTLPSLSTSLLSRVNGWNDVRTLEGHIIPFSVDSGSKWI